MSAAARAASVAPSTAMPASACLRAGASFTPSPVIPTTCPAPGSSLDDAVLVLGEHLGEPVGLLHERRDSASSSMSVETRWRRGCRCPARPRSAISRAIAVWSPVTILTVDTERRGRPRTCVRESSRGGSASGSTPTSPQCPSSSVRATASEREPAAANVARPPRSTGRRPPESRPGRRDRAERGSTCGAPLLTCTKTCRRLSARSPRSACAPGRTAGTSLDGVARTGPRVARRGQHRLRRSRRGCPAATPAPPTAALHRGRSRSAAIGSTDSSRFWVRVPVLSEHSTSIPPSSSTAARWLTTALLCGRAGSHRPPWSPRAPPAGPPGSTRWSPRVRTRAARSPGHREAARPPGSSPPAPAANTIR